MYGYNSEIYMAYVVRIHLCFCWRVASFPYLLLTFNRFIDYQGTLSASDTSLSLLEHWCDLEDWLDLWNECNVLWFEQRIGGRGWIFWIIRSVFVPTPYPRAMPH